MSGDRFKRRFDGDTAQCGCWWEHRQGWGDVLVECPLHHSAHNAEARLMKSTKRMRVPGGWLYQVTTEGPHGYAEALAFVPGES